MNAPIQRGPADDSSVARLIDELDRYAEQAGRVAPTAPSPAAPSPAAPSPAAASPATRSSDPAHPVGPLAAQPVLAELRAEAAWSGPPVWLRERLMTAVRERAAGSAVAVLEPVDTVAPPVLELSASAPTAVEPAVSERAAVEPDLAAAAVVGPDVTGLDAVGPDAAGLDVAEPDAVGLDVVGPDVAGLDVAGLDVAGEVVDLAAARSSRSVPPRRDAPRPAGSRPGVPRRRRLAWAIPAAAAAAAVFTVAVLGVERMLAPSGPPTTTYAATGTQLAGGATATIAIAAENAGFSVKVTFEGLPGAAPGSYYAAWLRGPQGVVPLGSFHARRAGTPVTLWSAVDPADYPTFLLTLQAEGDPPSPSALVVMTASLTR